MPVVVTELALISKVEIDELMLAKAKPPLPTALLRFKVPAPVMLRAPTPFELPLTGAFRFSIAALLLTVIVGVLPAPKVTVLVMDVVPEALLSKSVALLLRLRLSVLAKDAVPMFKFKVALLFTLMLEPALVVPKAPAFVTFKVPLFTLVEPV